MIQQAQQEIDDVKNEHQRAMESLLDSVREMSKELKQQLCIIDSYIPAEFLVTLNFDFGLNKTIFI
jgi:kinesin family protein 3/17